MCRGRRRVIQRVRGMPCCGVCVHDAVAAAAVVIAGRCCCALSTASAAAVDARLPLTMSTKPPEPAAIYLAGSTPGVGGGGPAGGPGATAGLLHAFPSRPLQPTDAVYNQPAASIYSAAAAAAAQAYIPFGAAASDSSSAFYSALVYNCLSVCLFVCFFHTISAVCIGFLQS